MEHSRRRHRLALVGAVAVVVALGASGYGVLHSPLLAARHLRITGAVHESTGAVLRAAAITGSPPLIDIDTAAAARAIEALPWVATAVVGRHWPETLSIAITERTAVGDVALSGGGYAVVDADGRVLERVGARPTGLLSLTGVGRLPRVGSNLGVAGTTVAQLAHAIPTSFRPGVESVGMGRTDGLVIQLSVGPTVIVGTLSALGEKFVALATLLSSERQALLGARVVDLRVPQSPLLTPPSSGPNVR